MFNKILLFVLVLIVFIACNNDSQEKKGNASAGVITVVDDLGDTLTFNGPPKKIVTLAPNLTEIVFALGIGDRLVANTKYCNYPPAADTLPEIGDLLTVNYEMILTIKPDLVLQTIEGNKKEVFDRLTELGIKVFVSNPRDYEGIKKTVRDIAIISGVNATADSMFIDWDTRMKVCAESNYSADSLNVMFMVSANPVMLAGENTFVNEYLKLLGLHNIASGVLMNYPVFSREKIYEINPDYIFYPGMEKNVRENVIRLYPEWKKLKVMQEGNFYTLDPDLYYRPGPRFIDALEELNDIIARQHRQEDQHPR